MLLAPGALIAFSAVADIFILLSISNHTTDPSYQKMQGGGKMPQNPAVTIYKNDGAARDVAGLSQVDLPVYARGLTANSSPKNGPVTVGAEIGIDGVIIRSGDLIIGDRDGVTVLPQEKIPEALEGMGAVRARERNIEERIAAGMTMPDWVKEFLASDRVKYIK